MKNSIKIFFFIIIILNSFENFGQEKEFVPGVLNPDQRLLLKNQRELMIQNREKFKASLTQEQINILESKELSPKVQQAALMASLNESQKALIFENISKAKQIKDDFRNTLSEEQRQKIRRLNEFRQRELIREPRGVFLPRK